jgi:Ca2+-binding RTX toxin-like protein
MSFSPWKQFVSLLFSSGKSASRRRRNGNELKLDRLESRLALTVNVTFLNGALSVVGDNASNVIDLTRDINGNLVVTSNTPINFQGGVPTINNIASISVDGGSGNDVITMVETGGPLPRVTIFGGNGDDTLRGGSGNDTITGGIGLDTIFGGAGEDQIFGEGGNDDLRGGTGNDFISGGPNQDLVFGQEGDDVIEGNDGNDDLRGGTGSDLISGGIDNDLIFGQEGDDILNGDDGIDDLRGGTGSDIISGGLGNDILSGNEGDDSINGEAGIDTLKGDAGDDVLGGGTENDTLTGGAGNDQLKGEQGNDTYVFDPDLAEGIDSLFENSAEGMDRLNFSTTTTVGVTVDLGKTTAQAVTANLTIILSANNTFENATGGALNDTFIGNTLANRYVGGAGLDTFVHHGNGDGFDVVADMTANQGDKVSFITGGALSAADLTIDATAKILRDVPTNSFGFNFTAAVLSATSSYLFGTTDTATAGSLFTFNGAGGFSLGSNSDTLVAVYACNGATVGGAAFRQRILDYSANGNTLAGRDGNDVLDGGAGNDNLNGDQGFNPGGDDVLTGGIGDDIFLFGQPFTGATQAFGNDNVTDFGNGLDKVKLAAGLSVKSGLGTSTVIIWNGVTNFGTIFASNGRVWVASDFI